MARLPTAKSIAPLSTEQYSRDRRDMKMSTKIKVVAVVASAAALTGGITVGAQAASRVTKTTITRTAVAAPNGLNNATESKARGPQQALASVLADLVKKGTITQSQADAIAAAVEAARPADRPDMPRGPRDGGLGGGAQAKLDLISKTIGVDTATILTKIKAGDSLATIAGDKKAALIAALVAEETQEIDAAVTAGKLTAAQATSMKANLTARITAMVEASPARIGRGMDDMRGGMKGGRGGHGPMMGGAPVLPGATPKN